MAGEMLQIDPITGREPDGTVWPLHAAIAQAVGGELRPFDQYQGPYILIAKDVRIGPPPYAFLPPGAATRLWVQSWDGIFGSVWREDTDTFSPEFPLEDTQAGIDAALFLVDNYPDDDSTGIAFDRPGLAEEAQQSIVGYALATGQGQFVCNSRGVEIFDTPSGALAEFAYIEEEFGIDGDAALYGLIPIDWKRHTPPGRVD